MFDVRPTASVEEFGRALYGIGQYFGGPATPETLERLVQVLPIERMHAAFDEGEIVGGAGAFPFELSVPGGRAVPCGGVTVVGVYPTHRRRGVLRSMMHAQLHDIHERGEPIAALWASEETIYGRFGYGLAAWAGEMTISREWSHFAQPLERRGRVRFVQAEEAVELFPRVWAELMKQRPGVFSRTDAWWKLRRTRIPDEEKANPKRFVVLEIEGDVQAYAVFKSHMAFDNGVGASKLEVFEAVGATPQATAEIWRFLFDIDWQATIQVELIPPDHPLFFLLANPRRAAYRMIDSLWVRIVDVETALAGRAFAGSASVVLDVHDAICPWNEGRWRVSADGAARTEDAAEISLDVAALGSAYLGAVPFSQLREGRRIDELVDGAVERADSLFAWRPLPWCPEIF